MPQNKLSPSAPRVRGSATEWFSVNFPCPVSVGKGDFYSTAGVTFGRKAAGLCCFLKDFKKRTTLFRVPRTPRFKKMPGAGRFRSALVSKRAA